METKGLLMISFPGSLKIISLMNLCLTFNDQVSTTKILMVRIIVNTFASFSHCLSAFWLEISTYSL